jgi:excisionase family DNA binding protein
MSNYRSIADIPLKRRSYTVPETARMLGISISTVNRMIRDKQLASAKVLKRRLITDEAINALLQSAP